MVSAACADRSAFKENPCACTALQQLAALSPTLKTETPWNALADTPYCSSERLKVMCKKLDGVQLPQKGEWWTEVQSPPPRATGGRGGDTGCSD